jgi:hypothetical protein
VEAERKTVARHPVQREDQNPDVQWQAVPPLHWTGRRRMIRYLTLAFALLLAVPALAQPEDVLDLRL